MKPFDAGAYTITVKRQTVDGESVFYGSAREFPDVAVYEHTNQGAYEAVISVIEALHATAIENNMPFPAPREAEGEFSGRITLRLPASLHRAIAGIAEENNTSLNAFITMTLAVAEGEYRAGGVPKLATAQSIHRAPTFHAGKGAILLGSFTETFSSLSAHRVHVGESSIEPAVMCSGTFFYDPIQMAEDDDREVSVPASLVWKKQRSSVSG